MSSVSLGIILHMWLATLVQICSIGNEVATINSIINPMNILEISFEGSNGHGMEICY